MGGSVSGSMGDSVSGNMGGSVSGSKLVVWEEV